MLDFMDYVQNCFYHSSNWNRDNSYGSLTATARALLDFDTPRGIRLNVSSLSSPNFATSYTLGSVGIVDGSLSYLYSSLPLNIPSASGIIPLRHLIHGYRQLQELRPPDQPWWWEIWHEGKRVDRKATLLYGHLHLPTSYLSALYLRRLSPTTLLKLSTVSSSSLPSGGAILALLSHDVGKYSLEGLCNTDSALLGVRGLYNFGPNPCIIPPHLSKTQENTIIAQSPTASPPPKVGLNGRFSAGLELYYGLLNASGGMSTGIRFATLPQYTGFPYTMTLTLNPLMGNLSSTYAVKAGPSLALCSRFDFNVYSYESDLQVGLELWRRRAPPSSSLDWVHKKLKDVPWESDTLIPVPVPATTSLTSNLQDGEEDEDATTSGVLKARLTHDWTIGLLWEGRAKELLYSCGVSVDLKRREKIFRGVGVEVGYSS